MNRKIGIVYNPSAGGGVDKAEIKQAFADALDQLEFLDIREGIQKIAERAQSRNLDCIVAAGGDGTVNFSAQIAAKHALTLGVLPVGTLNHFAKDTGLPMKLEEAASVIVAGKQKKIDYGSVNGELFINNSSIGLYPAAVSHRTRLEDKIGKWPAAAYALTVNLVNLRTFKADINIDDKSQTIRTPLLFVGNNNYEHEKFGLADRIKLDEGVLFIYAIRANRFIAIIRTAISFLAGSRLASDDYVRSTKDVVKININRQTLNVALDGEVKSLTPPLTYRSHHLGINLLVP